MHGWMAAWMERLERGEMGRNWEGWWSVRGDWSMIFGTVWNRSNSRFVGAARNHQVVGVSPSSIESRTTLDWENTHLQDNSFCPMS